MQFFSLLLKRLQMAFVATLTCISLLLFNAAAHADMMQDAMDGDAQAQAELSEAYMRGKYDLPQDNELAFKWASKAAAQGNPKGKFIQGYSYAHGKGTQKDEQKGVDIFNQLIQQNDAWGFYGLGNMYLEGYYLGPDYAKAYDLLTKAEKQTEHPASAYAKTNIAWMYLWGMHVEHNMQEALTRLEQAYEQEISSAAFVLGFIYQEGLFAEKNNELAMAWFNKGRQLEDLYATTYLARIYADGKSTEKNTDLAIQLLHEAATKNFDLALIELGYLYESNLNDYKQAAHWYRNAAEQDYFWAQFGLAWLYAKHPEFDQANNNQEMLAWFSKALRHAENQTMNPYFIYGLYQNDGQSMQRMDWLKNKAEQGDVQAQSMLGYILMPYDHEQAIEWYKLAAAQEDAFAQAELGVSECDIDLLQKAAEQGMARAQFYLGEFYNAQHSNSSCEKQSNQPYEKHPELAFEWYEKAAKQKHVQAQIKLADMYNNGQGIPKNQAYALGWYYAAAFQGNKSAYKPLSEMFLFGHGAIQNNDLAIYWYQKYESAPAY